MAFLLAGLLAGAARSQSALRTGGPGEPAPLVLSSSSAAQPALPDAPGFDSSSAAADPLAGGGVAFGQAQAAEAGPYQKYILPNERAPRLTVKDKVILGIRDSVTPFSAAGWLIDAGYEQATNGSPNYGQTGKGFAQRLGAASARDVSEGIFTDSVLAPALHEDPRYYKMGPGHSFIKRLAYAGTRGLITRTDGGRETVNFAGLGGNLAGAALTQAYYPPLNRGLDETLKTFGTSEGGTALGYVVSEFISGALEAVHLKKTKD